MFKILKVFCVSTKCNTAFNGHRLSLSGKLKLQTEVVGYSLTVVNSKSITLQVCLTWMAKLFILTIPVTGHCSKTFPFEPKTLTIVERFHFRASDKFYLF